MRCATAYFCRLLAILVGLAAALSGVVSVARAQVRVFSVAGGAHPSPAPEGDVATRMMLDAGAPAPLADGGFLFADSFNDRVVRVTTTGRWSTVAGGTHSGRRGDGGPATKARLLHPVALAPLADGGFLVSDNGDHRVRRVFPDGMIRTVAGSGRYSAALADGGPAVAARLRYPTALAIQPDGGFLVAAEDRVRRVGPDGTITTLAGTGRAGFSGDGGPATRARIDVAALAVQHDGGVLIAGGQRVRRVAADGTITTVAGSGQAATAGDGGPAVRAAISEVTDVHALADGGFLLADPNARRVRKVDAAGIISTVLGPSAFRDFAARATYMGAGYRADPFSVTAGPFSVTAVPDGLLMHNTDAILYAPTATPIRPAIRITGALVGRRQVTLTVDATQPGTATVRLTRRWARGTQRPVSAPSPLAAGSGTLRFDPGDRSGARVIHIELRASAGIATDNVALVLGRRLTRRLAANALDDAVGGGDEGFYYGPNRCRRMGPRRVDCEIAEQYLRLRPPFEKYKVVCASVRTVTLGRDGVLRERRYKCPRRSQPTFRPDPRYRSRPAVLPL